jgi:hypothetical protein
MILDKILKYNVIYIKNTFWRFWIPTWCKLMIKDVNEYDTISTTQVWQILLK